MREALGEKRFSSVFSRYLEEIPYDNDDELYWAGFQTSVAWYPIYDDIRYRNDVKSLETLLTERWGWFVRHHSTAGEWWNKVSVAVRYYLLWRAADPVSFGERYASLPRAAFAP